MKRIWLLLVFPALLCSKETQVSLSATHNLAYLGDRIGVTLLLKAESSIDDMYVDLAVEEKVCEIVQSGVVVKRIVPEGIVLEQKYELAFFNLGDFTIGPAKVDVYSQGEKVSELLSNGVPITIKPILQEEEVDLEAGKPPLYMSGSPLYLLRLIWIPIVMVVVSSGLWFLIRKNRRVKAIGVPALSPFRVLENELKRLMDERLFEKGFQVLFFLRLTHTLKKFLQGWHGVDAEEMTTEEIKRNMDGLMLSPKAGPALTRILDSADLVKFARYEMSPEEYDDIAGNLKLVVAVYAEEERKKEAAANAKGAEGV